MKKIQNLIEKGNNSFMNKFPNATDVQKLACKFINTYIASCVYNNKGGYSQISVLDNQEEPYEENPTLTDMEKYSDEFIPLLRYVEENEYEWLQICNLFQCHSEGSSSEEYRISLFVILNKTDFNKIYEECNILGDLYIKENWNNTNSNFKSYLNNFICIFSYKTHNYIDNTNYIPSRYI